MKNGEVDILVFDAHADDVELSCGGTVLAAVARKQKVGIIDVTHGEMGTRGSPRERLRESQNARKALGALFRERLDFGDGNLATGREQELQLIEVIRRYRPSILIAPYPEERHPDHVRTGRLVTDAWFYAGLRKIETDLPPHRPQAIVYYLQNYFPLPPSFIVDISAVFAKKMKAIACYKSQFYDPRSKEPQTMIAGKTFIDTIEGRARHFGAMIGAEFGEPFITRQPPAVADIVAAYKGREVS